ncbi:MAG: hypothetical protein AAF358_18905 [Pseudomonadota bacterium]
MKPEVHRFGKHRELLGFSQIPDNHNGTALIFLNSGLLPSMGPFRLFLEYANEMAEKGFVTVRFDQSGKGDSYRRDMDRPEANSLDFQAVQELLNSAKIERFVLIGLCSGADDATQIAEQFPCIDAVVLLDGFAKKTRAYQLRYYLPRVLRVAPLVRGLLRKFRPSGSGDGMLTPVSLRNWESDDQMVTRYQNLLDRGVKMLAIFTGGIERYYNHEGQLGAVLGTPDHLTEIFQPAVEHIYPTPDQRSWLKRTVTDWLEKLTL